MNHYPHKLRILRDSSAPGSGNQSDDGVWVPVNGQPQNEVIYDGTADVQDGGSAVQRDNVGSPTQMSDAIVFLADESSLSAIKPADTAEVTWEDGSIMLATVNKVRKLDGTIFLKRL